jgi:hypothetical protein
LPALVFASQSPYPGWQNVVNSRNVMRNKNPKFLEMEYGGIHAAAKGAKIFQNQEKMLDFMVYL